MSNDWKFRLGSVAFKLSKVKRIHIIGCARSGTTFLQYCMLAYENTSVANAETSPHYPGLLDKTKLAVQSVRSGSLTYITKRSYGWFLPEKIDELLGAVDLYRTGIVLMIRDPRAVLRSVHRRAGDEPYVDEERWLRSINAGETVWEQLRHYPLKCIVKYEDLMRQPDEVDRTLRQTFSLRPHKGVAKLNQVKTNVERLNYKIAGSQQAAMHSLRNADVNGLDQPRGAPMIASPAALAKYEEFLETYYPNSVSSSREVARNVA